MKFTDKCILAVVALSDCQKVNCSKNTPVGSLYAEKIAEVVLLYAFTMAFPKSPF